MEQVDFDSMKDENGNLMSHLIIISDDVRQFQHEPLQSLRSEGKITVVLLLDPFEKREGRNYTKLSSNEGHTNDLIEKPPNSIKIQNSIKLSLNEL